MYDIDILVEHTIPFDMDVNESKTQFDMPISGSLTVDPTNDYNKLINKPTLNGVEIVGDGVIQPIKNDVIENIFRTILKGE